MSTIDLNAPPPNHNFKVVVEREESAGERRIRLLKDLVLFGVAVVFVCLIVWLCFRTVLDPVASADEKKWAMSILSAATGGIVGYLVRR